MSKSMSTEIAEREAIDDHDTGRNSRVDVTDGGLIGAVGGGIVGALAGGPVGAVIGAVVGGGASAFAVDLIDTYDHESHLVISAQGTPSKNAAAAGFDQDGLSGSVNPLSDDYLFREVPVIELLTVPSVEDQTRYRAYELWQLRGRRIGFPDQDWYDAEREVMQQESSFLELADPENLEEVEDVVGYSS